MRKALATCMAALGLGLAAGTSAATPHSGPSLVDGVRSLALPSGQTEIRVMFDHPLAAAPHGFRIVDPDPAIVLDLANVLRPDYEEQVKVNIGAVRDVEMAQERDGVRMVVRLDNPEPYRARVDGKDLWIVVGSPRAPGR